MQLCVTYQLLEVLLLRNYLVHLLLMFKSCRALIIFSHILQWTGFAQVAGEFISYNPRIFTELKQHIVFSSLRVLGITGGNRALAVLVLGLGLTPVGANIVSSISYKISN